MMTGLGVPDTTLAADKVIDGGTYTRMSDGDTGDQARYTSDGNLTINGATFNTQNPVTSYTEAEGIETSRDNSLKLTDPSTGGFISDVYKRQPQGRTRPGPTLYSVAGSTRVPRLRRPFRDMTAWRYARLPDAGRSARTVPAFQEQAGRACASAFHALPGEAKGSSMTTTIKILKRMFGLEPRISREQAMAAFGRRYASFNELLQSNADLAAILAKLDAAQRGDKHLETHQVRRIARKAVFHCERMAACLNDMSRNRYKDLELSLIHIYGGLIQVEHHAAAGNGQGSDFSRIGRQGVLMQAAGVVGVALVMVDVQHHQKGFGFGIEGHTAALFHLAKFARGQTEAESQYQSQDYVTHSHVLPPYAWRFLAASSALAP